MSQPPEIDPSDGPSQIRRRLAAYLELADAGEDQADLEQLGAVGGRGELGLGQLQTAGSGATTM